MKSKPILRKYTLEEYAEKCYKAKQAGTLTEAMLDRLSKMASKVKPKQYEYAVQED
jgi:hypothetical protein